MYSFNDRLFNELFCEKKVKINNELYSKYYYRIWNNDQYFIRFLNSKSEDIQKNYAKRIFKCFIYNSTFHVPEFSFDNLFISEQIESEKEPSIYQGQIHSSHSVMLYILGVWLFFNHPVFNKYLMAQFRSVSNGNQTMGNTNECAFKSFLTAWRAFAIYHDIGYTLECNTNSDGYCLKSVYNDVLSKYNQLELHCYYDLNLKAFSNLIFVMHILEESDYQICEELTQISNHTFNNKAGNVVSIAEIKKVIKKNYFKLENINTYEQLKSFFPFINKDDLILIIKDKNADILSIQYGEIIYYKNGIDMDSKLLNNLLFLGSEECSQTEFYCEYYVNNPKKIIEEYFVANSIHQYYGYFYKATNSIYKKLSFEFLTITNSNSIQNLKYKIYDYLKKEISLSSFQQLFYSEIINNKKEELAIAKESIIDILTELADDYNSYEEGDNVSLKLYEYLSAVLSTDEAKKKIVNEIIKHDENTFLSHIQFFLPCIISDKSIKSNEIISSKKQHNKYHIAYDYFYNNLKEDKKSNFSDYKKIEQEKILEFLEKQCINMGIINNKNEFENILNYHLSHSTFDHGVVSASLLAQSYIICKDFYSLSKEEYNFIFSLRKITSYDEDIAINKTNYAYYNAILAILVHNIYPNVYKKLFNSSFSQMLNKNAFSYFAAFCDSLQRWDRPRTVNYSKDEIRGDYIVGNEFDIVIQDKYICIKCLSSELEDVIYKNKNSLDEFLLDGSKFIKLNVQEKNDI